MAVPLVLIIAAALFRARGVETDWIFNSALISVPLLAALWLAVYFGLRIVFLRDAVRVVGAIPASRMQRIVDTADGAQGDGPELVIKVATRCTLGPLGRCQVEFFRDHLRIWRGPRHPVPRWQLAYEDFLHAESVDLVLTGRGGDVHQYFVRLVATRPRIAFVFGSVWSRNDKTRFLMKKLRERGVPSFDESSES